MSEIIFDGERGRYRLLAAVYHGERLFSLTAADVESEHGGVCWFDVEWSERDGVHYAHMSGFGGRTDDLVYVEGWDAGAEVWLAAGVVVPKGNYGPVDLATVTMREPPDFTTIRWDDCEECGTCGWVPTGDYSRNYRQPCPHLFWDGHEWHARPSVRRFKAKPRRPASARERGQYKARIWRLAGRRWTRRKNRPTFQVRRGW